VNKKLGEKLNDSGGQLRIRILCDWIEKGAQTTAIKRPGITFTF
jgi:hypothetical protein